VSPVDAAEARASSRARVEFAQRPLRPHALALTGAAGTHLGCRRGPPHRPAGMAASTSRLPAVVIDCGTGYTKMGYAGNSGPNHIGATRPCPPLDPHPSHTPDLTPWVRAGMGLLGSHLSVPGVFGPSLSLRVRVVWCNSAHVHRHQRGWRCGGTRAAGRCGAFANLYTPYGVARPCYLPAWLFSPACLLAPSCLPACLPGTLGRAGSVLFCDGGLARRTSISS
jgi:hypothetical protein